VLTLIASGLAAVLSAWIGLLLWFARPLVTLWHEPVFRDPVLILESDDWGPGPAEHAKVLLTVTELLREFGDREHRHPVMTLGILLAVPGGAASDSEGIPELTLLDPAFHPLVAALRAGVREGVFHLQLHGRSHYWPEALAAASRSDPAIARWLTGPDAWRHETLPAALQSRWAPEVGGKPFPIPDTVTRTAAEEEAMLFAACLGTPATVAVPTTFVWNPAVERGWAAAGIRGIVTPGRYFRHRGQFADPASAEMITNGTRSNGILYVVRDQYFEPFKGHTAVDGLRALEANTALGRPTLLEIHRANFLDPGLLDVSLAAIRGLLREALGRHPDLRFLSTLELVEAVEAGAPGLIDQSFRRRLAAWCARVRTLPRFWRLARLTGLAFAIAGAQRLAGLA